MGRTRMGRTDGQTDGRTDGQGGDYMLPQFFFGEHNKVIFTYYQISINN